MNFRFLCYRFLILNDPLLTNKIYQKLAQTNMTKNDLAYFYPEYYHGSVRGFLTRVLAKAHYHYDNKIWREYLTGIRKEEGKPKIHALLFEDLIFSLGIAVQKPMTIAEDFVEKCLAGYTKNLIYSCGYALMIEVEADYQIALVEKFTEKTYGAGSYDTTYFDVHLANSGEEEHA